jgi:hypothetical protein
LIFFDQSPNGKRPGGFIAVDSRGYIHVEARRRGHSAISSQFKGAAHFVATPVADRRRLDVAQDCLNFDGFAPVTAQIFAESQHRKSLRPKKQKTQRKLFPIPKSLFEF